MKYLTVILGLVLLGFGGYRFLQRQNNPNLKITNESSQTGNKTSADDAPLVTVLAENLDTPWALAFLPDQSILVTERQGTVRLINSNGIFESTTVATILDVQEDGEGGLLGITVHPEFENNKYVYFYYTYASSGNNTLNRVTRMVYENKKLSSETTIVDAIPGASNHNGGRIKFGPDKYLYIATGDAQEPSQSQLTTTLGGKILRVTDEGKAAPGNPFNNPVFSYGHRNVQGLAWDKQGNLWATEHGRSGIPSGLDELNLIEGGKNYGWPEIQGDETRVGMEAPKSHSGGATWAPSGAAFVGKSLFFTGLRGKGLFQAIIENGTVNTINKHLDGEYGRIREVVTGPDGMLYITTSNKDGRGLPAGTDDRVLRINPQKIQ